MQAASQPMAAAAQSDMAPQQEEKGFFASLKSAFTFGGSKSKAPVMKRRESIEEMDRNLSCEEMDSDDLGGELNLSDCEDGAEERAFRRNYKQSKRAATNK